MKHRKRVTGSKANSRLFLRKVRTGFYHRLVISPTADRQLRFINAVGSDSTFVKKKKKVGKKKRKKKKKTFLARQEKYGESKETDVSCEDRGFLDLSLFETSRIIVEDK